MKVIRVFPRRTKMTPSDDCAFVGDSPLIRPDANEVHVSVAFTWDIEEGVRLYREWGQYYPKVYLGGPAFGSFRGSFTPGFYVKQGIIFTSRGCNNQCPWCLVPTLEGKISHLEIVPGYIIQDNNLLQTNRNHLAKVFEMLRKQKRAVTFQGGLQPSLITSEIVDELRGINIEELFLSCDYKEAIRPLRLAVDKLSTYFSRRKLRCFVLIGFDGETMEQAEDRLIQVWEAGCLPFAQLYQPSGEYIEWPKEWQRFARTWQRPAATFAKMGLHNQSNANQT